MRTTVTLIIILIFPLAIFCQFPDKIKYDNLPLQEVLADLEDRYQLVFSYTSDVIDGSNVNIDVTVQTIENALDRLLLPLGLQYEVIENNYIVITKLKPKATRICASFINAEGEELSYVNVFLPKLKLGTSSDENGLLDWTPKIIGNEEVEISYIGYENHIMDVSSLFSCPEIILKQTKFSFEEVIVKEYVMSGIEQSTDMDHMVMRPKKIGMVPGLTDADVLQMVQLLPGVESIDESATGLHVRGGTPDQNLILYDGIPIYNGGHFFGMISGFNPNLIDRVDVYRSGFGPNYGGRVSSVIDIKSVSSIPERIKLDGGINFTHGDISMVLPLMKNKIGLVLGARKSYTDIVETPTYRKLSERVFRKGKFDDVNEEDDPEILDFSLAFDFNDYNGKILFEPSDKDKLSISYFQIDDNLNFDFRDFDDDFETKDKIVQSSKGWGAKWKRIWNSSYESSITFSGTKLSNNYEFSIVNGDTDEAEIEDAQVNNIDDKTLVWDNRWKLNRGIAIDFGAQYADLIVQRSWQFDFNNQDVDQEIDKNEILTGYLSVNSSIGNKLKSKLGLRWNHSSIIGKNYLEPRIAVQYLPSNSFQIKGAAGYYRQFMSQVIEFNDLGINQDFWVLADDKENIPVALSKNFSMGMIFHPKLFMLEVEGYYKQLEGLTSNLSGFRIEMDEEFEFGSGTSWGVDVLLKKRWNTFQSWISYSFSRSTYAVNLEEEILNIRAPHDRPHSFTFMNQYKNDRWNISLSWKIASGIVYTSANGLSDEDEEPEPKYELDEINSDRLPVSHRLDFSVMYEMFRNKGLSGKLGFSLLNIYNRENIMSREYFSVFDEEEDEYELQARDRAMLRFTPNIVLRIGFE